MTAAEARKFLERHEIEFVLAQFVDIHGSPKAKCVPVAHFEDLLTTGAGFAGSRYGVSAWARTARIHGDRRSFDADARPWMPGYARIACDGHVLGKPYEYCPRVALRAQLEKLEALGWTMYTGIEPEFMLLDRRPDGTLVPFDATDTLDKPCYDYKGLARGSDFLRRLVKALQEAGLDVYQIDHEDANGQFEVNFVYRDCLTSADNYTLFKMAASEIARRWEWCARSCRSRSRIAPAPAPISTSRSETRSTRTCFTTTRTSGDGPVESRLPLSRRHSRACARPHRACGAIDQFVQAPGRRPIAFGRDVGAGLRYLRRQQPDGDGQDSVRAARAAAADGSCNPYLTTAGIIAAASMA
jgi:glutamine synthetase